MAKQTYTKAVELGQDIFDLLLQEYGDIKAVFLMLADNPSLDLERRLTPGELVTIRTTVPQYIRIDQQSLQAYRTRELRVNCQEATILEDDCPLLTASGNSTVIAQGGILALTNCQVATQDPSILAGILTPQSTVLIANNNLLIL